MECPHCQEDLPARTCPACAKETPAFGRYCCFCGSALPEETQARDSADNGDDLFADRVLCSDGTCIGVINRDGVCNECGKPYRGDPE